MSLKLLCCRVDGDSDRLKEWWEEKGEGGNDGIPSSIREFIMGGASSAGRGYLGIVGGGADDTYVE